MASRIAGLLHTIIFNRALGYVTPRDVDSELFDITYVRTAAGLCLYVFSSWPHVAPHQVHCGDEEVDAKLEQKITEFYSFVDRRPSDIAQVRALCISTCVHSAVPLASCQYGTHRPV
jgi:autophagy-related protein 101